METFKEFLPWNAGISFIDPFLCDDEDDDDDNCLKLVIVTTRERIRGTFRSVVKVERNQFADNSKSKQNIHLMYTETY